MRRFAKLAPTLTLFGCMFTASASHPSMALAQSAAQLDTEVRETYSEFIQAVRALLQDDNANNSPRIDAAIVAEYQALDQVWKNACTRVAQSAKNGTADQTAVQLAANWMLNCKTVDQDVITAVKNRAQLPLYNKSLLTDVRAQLAQRPERTALVQFFYHKLGDFAFDNRGRPTKQQIAWDLAAAWLIPPRGRGDVTLVPLHEFDSLQGDDQTNQLSDAIGTLRGVIGDAEDTINDGEPLGWNSLNAFIRSSERLRQLLIDPLDDSGDIYSYDHWVISPVADLWLIPFPAMPLPESARTAPSHFYCIEEFKVSYSMSGKYLIDPPSVGGRRPSRKPTILSSPRFIGPSAALTSQGNSLNPGQFSTFSSVYTADSELKAQVPFVPGTFFIQHVRRHPGYRFRCQKTLFCSPARTKTCAADSVSSGADEGSLGSGLEREFTSLSSKFDALARDVAGEVGLPRNDQNVLLRGGATEANLLNALKAPGAEQQKSITVVCTHGFFLFEGWYNLGNRYRNADDPLMRSGLALAGAETTRRSEDLFVVDPNDGILYSREISQLELNGHDTVVLIACQTGVGEVFGGTLASLRHGFIIGGVNKVIATSWTVSAEHSRWFLRHFFQSVADAHNARYDHLHEAQIRTIEQLSRGYTSHRVAHPMYWAAFSLTGRSE